MDEVWEMQNLSTAYDDHLRYLDTSRPKKRRKPDQKHQDRKLTVVQSSDLSTKALVAEAQPEESPWTNVKGKRKREVDEPNVDKPAEEDLKPAAAADPGTSDAVPSSSTDPPMTKQESISEFTFYLHHPSLPSRHPVLILLPPDAILATSLTNRLVLEFPTIYVLHSQVDGKVPDGFVSEEDFFTSSKKELIEEVTAGEGTPIDGCNGTSAEGRPDMEEGEVDEGHLLEVLGKDLKGIAGSL